MSQERTPEQQAAYDAKLDQIAAAAFDPHRLVAGPFRYHLPVTPYRPEPGK